MEQLFLWTDSIFFPFIMQNGPIYIKTKSESENPSNTALALKCCEYINIYFGKQQWEYFAHIFTTCNSADDPKTISSVALVRLFHSQPFHLKYFWIVLQFSATQYPLYSPVNTQGQYEQMAFSQNTRHFSCCHTAQTFALLLSKKPTRQKGWP